MLEIADIITNNRLKDHYSLAVYATYLILRFHFNALHCIGAFVALIISQFFQ